MKRQKVLAVIGGGCLGLLVGGILGAIVGHFLVSVEGWEDRELYGFIGLVHRIRGLGLGVLCGGLGGLLLGSWFGIRSPQGRDAQPPG